MLSEIAHDAFQADHLFLPRREITDQIEELLAEMLPDAVHTILQQRLFASLGQTHQDSSSVQRIQFWEVQSIQMS